MTIPNKIWDLVDLIRANPAQGTYHCDPVRVSDPDIFEWSVNGCSGQSAFGAWWLRAPNGSWYEYSEEIENFELDHSEDDEGQARYVRQFHTNLGEGAGACVAGTDDEFMLRLLAITSGDDTDLITCIADRSVYCWIADNAALADSGEPGQGDFHDLEE